MKIKNILIGAAMAASLSAVSANGNYVGQGNTNYASGFKSIPSPVSNKKTTTGGRFSTDVDNYMGVNDWAKLKDTEKFFGFLGYNYSDSTNAGSSFNMGFAKVMKGTYYGFYFGGQLDGMKMTSTFSDDKDVWKNAYTYEAESKNSYTASLLVGLKKGMGIKTSMYYKPTTSGTSKSSYNRADLDEKPYTQIDLYDLFFDVSVGLGDKKSTHFNVGLDSNVAKATNENGFQDNSYYDLYIGGGLTNKKGWDLDLDSRWRITPVTYKHSEKKDYDHYGKSDNLVRFKAAKGFTLDATDKLTMKAKVAIPVNFGVKTVDDDAVRVDREDWIYSQQRVHYINLGTTPSLALGAVYQIKPKKLDLNIGTNLNLGDLGWDFVVTSKRDKTDSAKIDRNKTDVTFGFDSTSLNVTWNSGFTAYLGKSVTLDANYNIVGNLLTGFSNNSDTLKRDQDFGTTINKVLIPESGLSFILSMKL